MHFVNPIWLWTLAGLIVPIGIHLLSRKTGPLIKFGSIRHLRETTTRQFKSIRLNELALLALRCLFIILLSALLAGLHLSASNDKFKWLLIEQGVESDPDYASLIDSLTAGGYENKLLAPGFPNGNGARKNKKVDYWNLIQELKTEGDVIVLSYNYAEGFKGKRIDLPNTVRWLSVQPDSMHYILDTLTVSNDSAFIRSGVSRPNMTSFQTVTKINTNPDSISNKLVDTISVTIVFEPSYEHDKNILVAALIAIQQKLLNNLKVTSIPASNFSDVKNIDWLMWLSDASPPNQFRNLIRTGKSDLPTENLFVNIKTSSGNTWLLTQRLNEGVALQTNLAVQLAIMLNSDKKYYERVQELDRRVLPEKLRWSSVSEVPNSLDKGSAISSGEKYIGLALLFVLFAERLLAFKRDQ
jgi:hypothetical protein